MKSSRALGISGCSGLMQFRRSRAGSPSFALPMLVSLGFLVPLRSHAASWTWDGQGGNNNWGMPNNWNPDTVPDNDGTADVAFGGSVRLSPFVNVPYHINGLTFNNTAGEFILSGASLTIGAGGITHNDNSFQRLRVPIVLSADQVWSTTSNGGMLLESTAPVSGSGFDLTLSDVSGGSNPVGLDGVISGSGTSVICQGSGRIELGAANTYTGGTVVSAGTLRLLNTAGSATGTGGVIVESGGVLDGDGAIAGSVDNAGHVAPGDSVGTLSVGGGYTQLATGHLDIRLQGAGAGQFDQLAISGPAVLGGTLDVTTSFFTPSAGQQFTIMTYASKTGDFAAINLPTVSGLCFQLVTGPTGVVLLVSSVSSDCNSNGVPDCSDIASGTSLDCNANGTPDECEISGPWRAAAGGPSARYDSAMAYDATRGATVLFGGWDQTFDGETWEWDGGAWSLRSSGGPGPRRSHAMAYDAARAVVVLFGGYSTLFPPGPGPRGDTWEWNGAAWSQVSTTGPLPRSGHAMAYDSARGKVVLFGGTSGLGQSSVNENDTWEWDGSTWTQRDVSGPSGHGGHAMVYDSDRQVTVLFGISSSGETCDNPKVIPWSALPYSDIGSTSEARDDYHTDDCFGFAGRSNDVVYAITPDRDTELLVTGCHNSAADTNYDSRAWVYEGGCPGQPGGPTEPIACNDDGCMEFASAPELIFPVSAGVTYYIVQDGWNGGRGDYGIQVSEVPPRRGADDGVQVVFQGAQDLAETWEWNGSVWALRSTAGPSPRQHFAMAYDSVERVTVLFGGATSNGLDGETWEWNGTAWRRRATIGPSPRSSHVVAYDGARGEAVLFGGLGQGGRLGDTWLWDSGSDDCDTNGISDECDPDCNTNGIADGCDVSIGASEDFNADGVPDECQGAPPGSPGDADADGDVDLTDYRGFQSCMSGPGGGIAGVLCDSFDFDADGDVDSLDFAEFQTAFGS